MRAWCRATGLPLSLVAVAGLAGCADAPDSADAPVRPDPSYQVVAPPGADGPPQLAVGLPQTELTPTSTLLDQLEDDDPDDVGFQELLGGLVLARAPGGTDLRLYAARVEDGEVAAEALSSPFTLSTLHGEPLGALGLGAPPNMMPDDFVPGNTFLPGEEIVGSGSDPRGRDVPVLPRSGTLLPKSIRDLIHPGLGDARAWPVTGIVDGIHIVDGILQPEGPGALQQAARNVPHLVFTVFPDRTGSGGEAKPGVLAVFSRP